MNVPVELLAQIVVKRPAEPWFSEMGFPNSRKVVPVQVVDATPSELEALLTGGVYDPKKTYAAFGDAER